jgi:hypothetical protein
LRAGELANVSCSFFCIDAAGMHARAGHSSSLAPPTAAAAASCLWLQLPRRSSRVRRRETA